VASLPDSAEPPLQIAVCGASGATGRLVVEQLLHGRPEMALCGALVAPDDDLLGAELAPGVVATADADAALARADVVVDFSAPAGTAALLRALERGPLPAVIGTTGLTDEHEARLRSLAARAPVVVAPNMSLGVNVLRRLVRDAARALGASWDLELVEIHHRRKVDAPSGTALALVDDLVHGGAPADRTVGGRHGAVGPRADHEIGVHAVRGGDVAGEHTVYLLGDGERLELTHRAGDRRIFALGALRAAAWAATAAPGRYGMDEVLFGDDS